MLCESAELTYCGGGDTMRINLDKEDGMSKEKSKQKANAKKKPQHTLKEKRQAKKGKGEGALQMMPK
jgi:hypothetical protein